ncbi:MAG: hypothetical protein SGBAC_010464 [Bacillariaceae sp.]
MSSIGSLPILSATLLLLTMVASNTHAFTSTTSTTATATTTSGPSRTLSIHTPSRVEPSSSFVFFVSSLSMTDNDNSDNIGNDAAQQLLDKAAQLRAEIAAMEGKTVEQVNQEAQQKKQDEQDRLVLQAEENAVKMAERKAKASTTGTGDQGRSFVQLPNTVDDMIRQASRAVERAYEDGKTRQTVRFHLVPYDNNEIANSNNRYQNSNNYNVLEENQWPGGAQQMYREAAKPMTTDLLREIRITTSPPPSTTKTTTATTAKTAMDDSQEAAAEASTTSSSKQQQQPQQQQWSAPKIIQQDIWDFDGSALHTAEASVGASGDIQALVFANTDVKYIRDIDEISTAMGKDRLFLLVNPFWRNLDSWSFNILAPKAKEKAQKIIFDVDEDGVGGYDETYVNMVFQVRGEKCIAIKAYPYDWQIFAMREDDYYPSQEYSIRLGSSQKEPTSSLVTKLLNERPEFKETKTMRQFRKL